MTAFVLDTGALIAFERRNRVVVTMVGRARQHGDSFVVPAPVVAQAWRDGARQSRLAALLASDVVDVPPFTSADAKAAGVVCGVARTADIVDAAVVVAARRTRSAIITSDPGDLRALDPTLTVRAI